MQRMNIYRVSHNIYGSHVTDNIGCLNIYGSCVTDNILLIV